MIYDVMLGAGRKCADLRGKEETMEKEKLRWPMLDPQYALFALRGVIICLFHRSVPVFVGVPIVTIWLLARWQRRCHAVLLL